MKEKIIAALKRAAWTAAEVALAMIPVNAVGLGEVNWLNILSVSAVAAIVSILKSIVVSMPEVKLEREVKEQAAIIQNQSEFEEASYPEKS